MKRQGADNKAKVFKGARLTGVKLLGAVVPDFPPMTLLHAGPGYTSDTRPAAVTNAAVHALMFEGLAQTTEEALSLLDEGSISLKPAQDYGVVTPLAQVVSASMPVFIVGDESHQAYAPLAEGPPPGLRFGSPDRVCVQNLKIQGKFALEELSPALGRQSVDVAEVIHAALEGGNDCHSLTNVANQALVDSIEGISEHYRAQLAANQGFVLPILMAASAWVLATKPGAIRAVGGNGEDFGIQLKGGQGWHRCHAKPPLGPRFPGQEQALALEAIGDSAVIDFCGLGGQALEYAPDLVRAWRDLLPPDWKDRSSQLLNPDDGLVSPERVLRHKAPPLVHLAILGSGSSAGLLGRGFYEPTLALFESLEKKVESQ